MIIDKKNIYNDVIGVKVKKRKKYKRQEHVEVKSFEEINREQSQNKQKKEVKGKIMKKMKVLAVATMVSLGALSMVACKKGEPEVKIERDVQGSGIGEYKPAAEAVASGNKDTMRIEKDGKIYNGWGDDLSLVKKHDVVGKTIIDDPNLSKEQIERMSKAMDAIADKEYIRQTKQEEENFILKGEMAWCKDNIKMLDEEKELPNHVGAQYKEYKDFKGVRRYGNEVFEGSKLRAINALNPYGEAGYECRNGFIVGTAKTGAWYDSHCEGKSREWVEQCNRIELEVFKINNPGAKIYISIGEELGKPYGSFDREGMPLWIENDAAMFATMTGQERCAYNTPNRISW